MDETVAAVQQCKCGPGYVYMAVNDFIVFMSAREVLVFHMVYQIINHMVHQPLTSSSEAEEIVLVTFSAVFGSQCVILSFDKMTNQKRGLTKHDIVLLCMCCSFKTTHNWLRWARVSEWEGSSDGGQTGKHGSGLKFEFSIASCRTR